MSRLLRSIRQKAVVVSVIDFVLIFGGQSPWLTSTPNLNRLVVLLFYLVVPIIGLSIGISAVVQIRRNRANVSRIDSMLAYISLLALIIWLVFHLLFLIGEIFIGHA